MADTVPEHRAYEIVCPHCSKPFTAELMSGGAERNTGFKCPHCRLFVAFDRATIEGDEDEAS
jgi:DNA-directed RNA polymerase subunit RPC12/RpoP